MVEVLVLPMMVWMSTIAAIDASPDRSLAVVGGIGMLLTLLFAHFLTIHVGIDDEMVRIRGRVFLREFACSDVVAVGAPEGLCFFLPTGEVEDVEFVVSTGAYAVFMRPRTERIIAEVRERMSLTEVPPPVIGTDPPWDKIPVGRVVRRTINWPSRWVFVPWLVWVVSVAGWVALR